MVTVSSGTSTGPTVFPLMQCDSAIGDMITLGCLATGFSPSSVTYAWTKNDEPLTDFIRYPSVQNNQNNLYSAVSQLRVRREDFTANSKAYKCAVSNTVSTGQATYTPKPQVFQLPTLKVSVSYEDDGPASFSCLAQDFSPNDFEIKWQKDGREISNGVIKTPSMESPHANGTTRMFYAASFLSVPPTEYNLDSVVLCLFKGKGADGPVFKNKTVEFKTSPGNTDSCPEAAVEVVIREPNVKELFQQKKTKLICEVKINKPSVDKIIWEDDEGNEMGTAFVTPAKGQKGKITVPLDITYEEWSHGIKRVCVVHHNDIADTIKKTYERRGGEIQRPSVFVLAPIEHTRKDSVTLTCYVKDFHPAEVFVSWLVDDEEANDYKSQTTNPVKENGSYSVYGQLSLSIDQWQRNDVVYSCAVYHESVVNTTGSIVRSFGYRNSEKINLVNLNMNVPETCKPQ